MSIMDSQNKSKLNSLLLSLPKGVLVTSGWLESQGVYRQLADVYVKGGWLERLASGVFKRTHDEVDWLEAVYALQTQIGLSVHPGGKTALQLQGYAHFLPLTLPVGLDRVAESRPKWKKTNLFVSPEGMAYRAFNLFGTADEKLPRWFKRFLPHVSYSPTNLFGGKKDFAMSDYVARDFTIQLSSVARAMFEVCYDVPKKESLEEASQLMEGLTTLQPKLVQRLLECCESVKTKRLFMVLAERHKHAWLSQLDLSKVDFGKGKRSLAKGGDYHAKYQMVLPKEVGEG
jgi:hypothetical protein